MSRVLYPQLYRNDASAKIPPHALIQLEDATRGTDDDLNPHARQPDADGEDALYVNSGAEVADGSTTGSCRSVHDGAFWVATDTEYTPGDIIGPLNGSFYAGKAGSGFKVIFQHESRNIALCDVVLSSGTSDDGFTDGTDTCDCDHCAEGTDLSGTAASPSACCTTHLTWEFVDPLTGDTRSLKWAGGDSWTTDKFAYDAPAGCANEYVWVWDQSAKTLSLTIGVDNGCSQICIVYEHDRIRCQCDNELELTKWQSIRRDALSCRVCLKPGPKDENASFPDQDWPNACFDQSSATLPIGWLSDISGFAGVSCTDYGGSSVQGVPWQYSGTVPCPSGSSTSLVTDMNKTGAHFTRTGTALHWEFDHYPITYNGEQITDATGLSRWTLTASCLGGVDPTTHVESYGIVLRLTPGPPPVVEWNYGSVESGCGVGIAPSIPNSAVLVLGPFDTKDDALCALNQEQTFTLDWAPGGYNCDASYFSGADTPAIPSTVTLSPVGGGVPDVCDATPPLYTSTPPTTDGLCASCSTDTPPVDDEGSCCATGSCLDISEADCSSIGGTWYATDIECDTECAAIGSCCACIRVYGTGGSYTDQFQCVSLLTQEECERSVNGSPAGWGGIWSQNDCGDGTGGTNDCGGVIGNSCTLGEQLGACCDGGTCAVTNDADCTAWYSGVDCTAVTCNVGACCQCSGVTEGNPCECADGKTSAECTALNGIFLGLGSTCAGPENQCNVNTCTGGTCTP